MNFTLEAILVNWVPLAFGLIGVLVMLGGVINLISGRERAFGNIVSGILVIIIAIGLRWLMENVVVEQLLNF
jgi:hypothetical protein